MNLNQYTVKSQEAIQKAQQIAEYRTSASIGRNFPSG